MKAKTKKERAKRTKRVVAEAKAKVDRAKASKTPKEIAIPLYDMSGKEVGSFALDKKIFTGQVHKGALYQAIRMYNANKRQGNASTKTRGDVSGGGKKPWRQKGTGRARAGSSRSPLWRGGGAVFGPHPRDFHYSIPKKIKRLAFISSINSKLNESKLKGIETLTLKEPKTKLFKAVVNALRLDGKALFVVDAVDTNLVRASRNIKEISVKNYRDFNTMDVLTCDTVVISKPALEKLPERFGGV